MRALGTLPLFAVAALTIATSAHAGPETALREFASAQIKKGVRTIGMGGDGATTGNYALVYQDHGTALIDYGIAHFSDTGNLFTFTAAGFTTPIFWDDAAFYVIAVSQHGTNLHVWDFTPSTRTPPSVADGSNGALFVKFAKPITRTLSLGLLASYETSQMTLLPDNGATPIRYETRWLPSGGLGLHWHPDEHWQLGARVLLNHDRETRDDASGLTEGLLRSYEYRLGGAWSPWAGTLLDAGAVLLDRSNKVDGTSSLDLGPTIGAEQVLVPKVVWARAGVDETTVSTGMSLKLAPFKLDLAFLYNLGKARIGDIFGKRNTSLIATLSFDYESLVNKK
jgi:hypothetical protein